MRTAWRWTFIVALMAADQAAKWVVRALMPLGRSRPVVDGFFDIAYVRNEGAAWGMLAGWRYAFVALAVAMLAFFWGKRSKVFGEGRLGAVSLVLLTAGIAGNTIDRMVFGYVTDFLDFHWGVHHFPVFNVADMCICIGAGLYVLASLADGAGKRGAGNGEADRP
jgi:signal peptidase II